MATTHFTVRIDQNLKKLAQEKAREKYGIGLGTLTKLFFQSFVLGSSVNFYVGDSEFEQKLDEILKSQKASDMLKKLGKAI